MTLFRPTSHFDKLLDKATSNLRLEPDWPTIIQICDLIRQGDVQPKYAVAAIKKKLASGNPHVAMFSLQVLESCVKNCGSLIHEEVGTKGYMELLRETVKTTTHENVKNKVLELLQTWAFAFRNSPKYRAVQDTVNIMKAEGYKFPTLKESDAMFSADTAPEWADGECCHRCRVLFGMVQRKHHCRACGQVFCGQCSSKSCTLPKFGIEREVRVCEACYEKVNKPPSTSKSDDLPVEYLTSSLAQQSQAPPPRKSDAELREEEELQLALALSQSEAEQKTKIHSGTSVTTSRPKTHSPPPVVSSSPETDSEMARYLNRSYWQQQSAEHNSPSAPASVPSNAKQLVSLQQNGVEEEMEEFVHALRSQVEIFVNRMKSNSSRGRSIANDSSVQTLFMNITAMHSKLLRYIQQQDDGRVYYEGLQDKLTQVKDARAALDALREEYKEKLRREAELAERQRQLQMAQKLDIMRKKKQEYLQYQRQLALQTVQEQEREMQMRQEQQKQQYLMGSYANMHYIPQGYENPARYPQPQMPPSGYPSYQPGAPLPPGGPMMPMPQDYMGTIPRGMMGPGGQVMMGQLGGNMIPSQMMVGPGQGGGPMMMPPPPGGAQGPSLGGPQPMGPGQPMGAPQQPMGPPQQPMVPPQIPQQQAQAPPPGSTAPVMPQAMPTPTSAQIGSPTMSAPQMPATTQQPPQMIMTQPPQQELKKEEETAELITFD